MSLSQPTLQSMLKRNAGVITNLHEDIKEYKKFATYLKAYTESENTKDSIREQYLTYIDWHYKEIDKMTKSIRKLVAIQKELKNELRECEDYINIPPVNIWKFFTDENISQTKLEL